MSEFPQGTRVMLWGRASEDCILLFGEGTYEGDNFVNGSLFPIVKLDDGGEITVHTKGVSVGRQEAVAATCRAFAGAVMRYDLNAFVNGKRPNLDDIKSNLPSRGGMKPPLSEAEPKTMTDRLEQIKRKIDYELAKAKLFQEGINAANKAIAVLRSEGAAIKTKVLIELANFDDVAPSAVEVAPVAVPLPAEVAVPPPPPLNSDAFLAEANRLAIED